MHKQQGLSGISMLVLLFIGGLLIKAGIALVPMYWDDRMVKTILGGLERSEDVTSRDDRSDDSLEDLFVERLKSNHLELATEGLAVEEIGGQIVLTFNYERRDSWFGNISLVTHFQHRKEYSK